jgi:flagellar hook-associated protein 1 FlgK
MRSAATALDALQKAASATQNNVTNASTPGYARQKVSLSARPYDQSQQLSGGVEVRGVISSRDEFAEQAVRHETSELGRADEYARQMAGVETNFLLDDTTGVANRMNELFSAFNSWSVAPLSLSEKQNVIAAAENVAEAFRTTAQSLQESGRNADAQIQTTLDRISDIAERIRSYNVEVRSNGLTEAGSSANVHADLEELSELVDFQTLWQDDGTVTVLIGRQTTLVHGDQKFGFSVSPDPTLPAPGMEGGIPQVQVIDANGANVTATMTSGRLGALLRFRNEALPGLAGSMTQTGDLNRLAATFATRVNEIITSGDPAAPKMFTWSGPGSAAQSLKVRPEMTATALSAADPTTTPATANGRALKLATLAHPGSAQDEVDGLSYISFFGRISASVGRMSAEATQAVEAHQQLQAQTLNVRAQISGVSLDEEAVDLVSIQRAYEATSRMISVIDELTKLAVNVGRN